MSRKSPSNDGELEDGFLASPESIIKEQYTPDVDYGISPFFSCLVAVYASGADSAVAAAVDVLVATLRCVSPSWSFYQSENRQIAERLVAAAASERPSLLVLLLSVR